MSCWTLRHEERYHTGYPDDTMVWDAKPTIHMLIVDGGLHPEIATLLHGGGTHTDSDGGDYTLTEGPSPVIHIDTEIADHGLPCVPVEEGDVWPYWIDKRNGNRYKLVLLGGLEMEGSDNSVPCYLLKSRDGFLNLITPFPGYVGCVLKQDTSFDWEEGDS